MIHCAVFEAFKEDLVKYNIELTVIILIIWSASLLQFTLVLTASKSKKRRGARLPTKVMVTDVISHLVTV
jgi:hypothetical protein